jgi:hypothetical protein
MAALLVVVDAMLFVVPLASLLCAYVLIARPEWFRDWVQRLYAERTT